jgi:hypothetical protein
MPAGSIKNNSKGDLIFSDFNIYGNKNICPFTLERVEDCKEKNSSFDNQLCFFMLETCYFQSRPSLKNSLQTITGDCL